MKTILSLLLAGGCAGLFTVPASAAPRPNVVVVLADDQGRGELILCTLEIPG